MFMISPPSYSKEREGKNNIKSGPIQMEPLVRRVKGYRPKCQSQLSSEQTQYKAAIPISERKEVPLKTSNVVYLYKDQIQI